METYEEYKDFFITKAKKIVNGFIVDEENDLEIELIVRYMMRDKKFEEINNSSIRIVSSSEVEMSKEEKSSAKKEEKLQPSIEEVKTYFLENNFPEQEAQKFYNYFSSVGWLVGGKTPMVNWQAAAENWIINAPKFISNAEQPNKAKHLNTTINKDYSEPL